MEVRLVRFGQLVIPSTNYKYIFKLSPLRLRGSGPFLSKPTKNVSSVIFLFQSSLQGAPHLSVSASHHTIPNCLNYMNGFHSQILKVSVSQVAFELSATLDFGLSLAPSLLLQKEAVRPDFLLRVTVTAKLPACLYPSTTEGPAMQTSWTQQNFKRHWWFGDSSIVNAKDDNEWFFE